MKELELLALDADRLVVPIIGERTHGVEATVLEVVFRLFVHEGTHLAGHTPYTLPLSQRLGNGDTIASLLLLGSTLGIEGFEKVGNETADRQQLLHTPIEIDMAFGQKVDIVVLRIASCIREASHLLRHSLCPADCFCHSRTRITLPLTPWDCAVPYSPRDSTWQNRS